MFFPPVVKRASLAFFSRFHLGGLHSSGCLNGATIRVDDHRDILATLDVNDGLKRITINGGNSYLSLAEVEVFGYAKPEFDSYKNIAGEGKASQWDNGHVKYGLAHLAIDGNTDGRWQSKSVTHTTKIGKDAWRSLDFSKT